MLQDGYTGVSLTDHQGQETNHAGGPTWNRCTRGNGRGLCLPEGQVSLVPPGLSLQACKFPFAELLIASSSSWVKG